MNQRKIVIKILNKVITLRIQSQNPRKVIAQLSKLKPLNPFYHKFTWIQLHGKKKCPYVVVLTQFTAYYPKVRNTLYFALLLISLYN